MQSTRSLRRSCSMVCATPVLLTSWLNPAVMWKPCRDRANGVYKKNPTRNLTIPRGILVRSRELESLALWLKEPTGQNTLILEVSSFRYFCAKHRDFLPGNFCTLCRILQVRVPIASLETVQKQCRNRALTLGQMKNDDFWSMTWWRFEWPQSQIWYTGRKMPTRLRSSQGSGHFYAGG